MSYFWQLKKKARGRLIMVEGRQEVESCFWARAEQPALPPPALCSEPRRGRGSVFASPRPYPVLSRVTANPPTSSPCSPLHRLPAGLISRLQSPGLYFSPSIMLHRLGFELVIPTLSSSEFILPLSSISGSPFEHRTNPFTYLA